MKNIHVIIAGAGPAGLTLALSLHQKNIRYTIIEGVDEDKLCADVGGGYDLGANAIKIFDQFGLGQAVRDRGARFDKVRSYSHIGKLSSVLEIPAEVEMSSLRRSTLQKIIVEKLSTKNIVFGSYVVSVAETEGEVLVRLKNGEEIKGDILVAADGVHSAVRGSILKDGPAEHVGVNCMWGRLKWEDVPALSQIKFEGAAMMIGNGQTFMAGQLDGQIIWTTFWQAEKFIRSENKQSAKEKAMTKLLSWNREMAEIVRLSSIDMISEVGIYDRPPAKTWHSKRTVMIGDAAHPMTPFLGAGANTAIADAFILGHLIDVSDSMEDIFTSFEKRRKKSLEGTVKTARTVCDYSLSKSKWKNWIMLSGMGLLPNFLLKKMILNADKVNDVSDIIE